MGVSGVVLHAAMEGDELAEKSEQHEHCVEERGARPIR